MKHRKLFGFVGAALLASSLAYSPGAGAQHLVEVSKGQTVLVGGVAVPVPTADGQVAEDVRVLNTDGSIKLFIPKGFSASAIPADLDAAASEIQVGKVPAGDGVPTPSHSEAHRHTSAYLWGGVAQDPNRRDTWMYDRTAAEHEADVVNMVIEINHGLRPAMETEQGIPQNWSPAHAYYDNDGYDGQCQKGGWAATGYSFTTICTSYNIQSACNSADNNIAGCAYVIGADGRHNGPAFQPSAFLKSGLNAQLRQNITRHEIGHTLGWGHNQGEPDSVMYPLQPDWKYTRITFHDTWDLSNKYRHAPDTCC